MRAGAAGFCRRRRAKRLRRENRLRTRQQDTEQNDQSCFHDGNMARRGRRLQLFLRAFFFGVFNFLINSFEPIIFPN